MKGLLYLLLIAVWLLFASRGWSQATVSYPFAVGNTSCGGSTGQIHFYTYNSTTNKISSITNNAGPIARYTPQLRISSTGSNTQRFTSGMSGVTYNPRDKNIYYLWISTSGSVRTYLWRWPIGTQPVSSQPASSRLDAFISFPAFILGLAFDTQGNGYLLEFPSKEPFVPVLKSIDFSTGVVGKGDTLQLTGGATIYKASTGDVAMTPSGQMLFVVDNKLFTPDYKSYTGTGKKLTCTYVDTVVNSATGNFVGLTFADGETISAYSGGSCPFFETNPLTAATTTITKEGTTSYSASDLATVVSGIGVAKKLVSATPTGVAKEYDVIYEILVKNYGNYNLSNVQVTDDLTAVNGSTNVSNVSASFVSNPAGLLLNNTFDGKSNINLLDGTGTLPNHPVDQNYAVIRVSCRLSNISGGVLYNNSASATGYGFNGDKVSDVSTNGSSPDLNNNDKPDDAGENQPTPLLISITAQTPPCSSLSTVLYKQDFGTGATIASLPTTPVGSTQYTGSTAQPLTIDQYMITQNVNNADNSRFISLADHTGGGRMMVVNADASNNIIYSATVSGLCASQQYSLLFFAAFAGNTSYQTICDGFGGFRYPKVRMRIRDAVSSAIITEMSTPEITTTSWGQYGMKWIMPAGFNSVIFELMNDGQGGCGNDIAIDDIQLGLCDPIPTVSLVNTSAGCIGSATEFTAMLNDAGVIPGAKQYQWQESVNSTSWTDITGATAQNYLISSLASDHVNKYYRVIVAAQGNIVSSSCRYISPAYLLEAKTFSAAPAGVLASSNNICPGEVVKLSVQGGTLGSNAAWKWYSSSCGETLVGTGASVEVSPAENTTYYVRAEGDCNTTTCSQITITFGNCTVLDCKYVNFTARVISSNAVKINWSLYCDQETSAFVVERKDASHFVPVYTAKGITELNRNINFETLDRLTGVNAQEVCYRLKTIHTDGRIDYSNVLQVKLTNNPDRMLIVGNPVRNELKVQVEADKGAEVRFELSDVNGRFVKKLVQFVVPGKNQVRMDVRGLPSGSYYFNAFIGGEVFTRKVNILK